MTVRDSAVASEPHPGEHVPAEALDKRNPLACLSTRRRVRIGTDGAGRQPLQNLLDQRQGLGNLTDAHPYARVDVTVLAHNHLETQVAVRRISRQLAGVKG